MRTRCLKGHRLTPDNLLFNKSGSRYCKLCAEIREIRDKRGTRQPKYRLPDTEARRVDPKFLPSRRGTYIEWTYELGDMPAWLDDPYALVPDDTNRVVAEVRAGREIGASRVDRLAGQDPALEAILLCERGLERVGDVPESVRRVAAAWAIRKRKEEAMVDRRRDPPVPGVNQIAHRIVKQVAEMETPEFRKCTQGSPHQHHVWSRGRIDDKYWCPGVEIPDAEFIPTPEEAAEIKARFDFPPDPGPEDAPPKPREEPVSARTKEGWAQASQPSRYFSRRRRR